MPRGGEEPLLGFFSVSPLTPGAWLGLLDDAGLPHSLRRLPLTVEVNGRRRHADARCLPVLSATAYLLSEERLDGSPSLRAWRLVARLADQVARNGDTMPDLSRFAAAFPPLGHCVVPDLEEFAEPPVPAEDVYGVRQLAAAIARRGGARAPAADPAGRARRLHRPVGAAAGAAHGGARPGRRGSGGAAPRLARQAHPHAVAAAVPGFRVAAGGDAAQCACGDPCGPDPAAPGQAPKRDGRADARPGR